MDDRITNNPRLQILIATFGEKGLVRLAQNSLPHLHEVEYIISCQNPSEKNLNVPEPLCRPDIKLFFSPTRGLSKNRNILFEKVTAPLALIADDDLIYNKEGLKNIIRTFEENPEIDFATFAYTVPGGRTEKFYPDYSFNLKKPVKGYFLTSFEIAFRTASVIPTGIKFNENFGIGAPLYGCGEEDLWIYDLLKHRLNGRFFPVFIAEHQGETTGIRNAAKPEVLRAQGVLIRKFYPLTSLLRIFLKGYRSSRVSGASLGHCLRFLFEGWFKNPSTKSLSTKNS